MFSLIYYLAFCSKSLILSSSYTFAFGTLFKFKFFFSIVTLKNARIQKNIHTSNGIGSAISAIIGVAALFIRPIILTTLSMRPANYGSKYCGSDMNISAFGTATLAFVRRTAHGIRLIQLY